MNGHRRTGKPVFPKTRQIKKVAKEHPPRSPRRKGGGSVMGEPFAGAPIALNQGWGFPFV